MILDEIRGRTSLYLCHRELNRTSKRVYGKRLFGEPAGIPIYDRAPALRPSSTGLAMTKRYAEDLGAFEQ